MRRVARLVGFLAVCLFYLVSVAAAHLVLLGFSRPARMRVMAGSVRLWARACLIILGFNINLHRLSDDLHSNRRLLVSNHQSYLDVVIIASVFPTLFVAMRLLQVQVQKRDMIRSRREKLEAKERQRRDKRDRPALPHGDSTDSES